MAYLFFMQTTAREAQHFCLEGTCVDEIYKKIYNILNYV